MSRPHDLSRGGGRARACLCLLLGLCLLPARAWADEVTLQALDGGFAITGRLHGYDGETYRLDTRYGELSLNAARVTCAGAACPDSADVLPTLRLSGSRAVQERLVIPLIRNYAQRNGFELDTALDRDARRVIRLLRRTDRAELMRITLHLTTTAEGLADLLANEADMVVSTRPLTRAEQALLHEAGRDDLGQRDHAMILAHDAITPIHAHGAPLPELTLEDLRAIAAGRIVNWSSLGGPDRRIHLHLPERTSDAGMLVAEQLGVSGGWPGGAKSHRDPAALARAVVADRDALGLTTLSQAGTARQLALRDGCGLRVAAAPLAVQSGDYPLSAPVRLYRPLRKMPGVVQDLLAFMRSPGGQRIARRAGFLDVGPQTVPIALQGARFVQAITAAGADVGLSDLQALATRLGPLERLTTTFRFEPGTSRLDGDASAQARLVGSWLRDGTLKAARLVFVGFSDSQGPGQPNLEIALKRAERVRAAVLRAAGGPPPDGPRIEADAFGEALPIACDSSAWGRQANRRVELWIAPAP